MMVKTEADSSDVTECDKSITGVFNSAFSYHLNRMCILDHWASLHRLNRKELDKASNHKSVITHADNVFLCLMTLTF